MKAEGGLPDRAEYVPQPWRQGDTPALARKAAAIRALAGERNAIILAHNYQLPEVQEVADFVGDSLGLALRAQSTDADTIVFCGVHFMAESADILSRDDQIVILPDHEAGCSLADMASYDAILCGYNSTRVAGNAQVRRNRGFSGSPAVSIT